MKNKTTKERYSGIQATVADIPEWITDYPELNIQVKTIRESLGISQEKLAENIGLTWRSIPNIENGKVNPKITTIKKIAEYLNCEFKILLIPKKDLSETNRNISKKNETGTTTISKRPSPDKRDSTDDNSQEEKYNLKRKKEYFWD